MPPACGCGDISLSFPLQSDTCKAKLVASQASLALHQMCVSIKSFSGVAIGWAGCATWSLVKACVAEQVAFHLFLALIVFS